MTDENRQSDDALTATDASERQAHEDMGFAYDECVSRMLSTDCSQFLEKRGQLTYLSWASAWDRVLREDARANYHVHQFDTGPVQQMPTGKGWMVWVDVTIHGVTRTMYLPVMDNRNKAITDPDAFDINKTIQRALAKGIAMHGLGLYVYRGEDVPEGSDAKPEEGPPEPDPIPQDTVDQLEIKAGEGTEAFRAYWQSLAKGTRTLVSQHPAFLESLKQIAAKADAEGEQE